MLVTESDTNSNLLLKRSKSLPRVKSMKILDKVRKMVQEPIKKQKKARQSKKNNKNPDFINDISYDPFNLYQDVKDNISNFNTSVSSLSDDDDVQDQISSIDSVLSD